MVETIAPPSPRAPARTARAALHVLAAASLLAMAAVGAAAQQAEGRVPAPAEVFGFEPGADLRLADHAQIADYFARLAAASGRVLLREIGRSVQGRPLLLAVISDEANLRELERHRSASAALARGRLADSTAARLARDGRAVVWIDGGLHATEVAGAQHTPVLAHHLATAESEEVRRIRRETILLLMPVMNPDGLDMVVSWYGRQLGTPYETSPLPWLYHVYAGHDNNRDWFMITQPETRAVSRVLYHEWYPQIVHNHHQVAPFPARIFVPPFAEPVNPRIPAGVVAGVNAVGTAMARRFAEEGKPGVVSRIGFDMWWNGGMRTAPYYHNMIGILTETALHRYATPRYYEPDSLPAVFARTGGLSTTEPSVFHPDPWRGGWWRLADAVDYMLTASMGVLAVAAERREAWLLGMHRLAADAVAAGHGTAPFAYVVPADQRDPWAARELLDVLRRGGVEVLRASAPFTAAGADYAAGSHILPAAQAFRPYLLDLMERQEYPDPDGGRGALETPYDVTGWTLPLQMGVEVVRIATPFAAAAAIVESVAVVPGSVSGSGRHGWLLDPAGGATTLAANRLLAAGARVDRATRSFRDGGREWPAGTFLVRPGRGTASRLEALAAELGLDFAAAVATPPVPLREQRPPRIGLYRSWVASMDEGWTRFVLERNGFAYDTLRDADVRRGALAGYDVIVLPHQGARSLLHGHGDSMPPHYAGGIGEQGVQALARYVRAGGTLVALGGASEFAIQQLGLPVANAVASLPADSFSVPGSLLRLRIDGADPLGWGMPAEVAAYFVAGAAFQPMAGGALAAAARFADADVLMSGWARGAEERLPGLAAVARVPLDRGEVVLYGVRPQFRAQPHGTFKLLFNALHHAALSPPARRDAALPWRPAGRRADHLATSGPGE
jgi:hypothetical protein